MSITAQSIIQRATDLLQDQTSVRWPINELIRWLNDAQRTVIRARPDAMNTTSTMTLAAGTRQDISSLTPKPSKLIDITRNMAATSAKMAVRKIERAILDAQSPNWHSVSSSVDIKHFMVDPRNPKVFYVYPPATALAQLEVMYSAYPTDIASVADGSTYTAVTGDISIPDIYADDLLNLMLYRAYSKDAEYAGNTERANAYLSSAIASLGAELQATIAVEPK